MFSLAFLATLGALPLIFSLYHVLYRADPDTLQCTALSLIAGRNKVLWPGSQQYADFLSSYWSLFEQQLQPSCVVQPDSAADVSSVIKTVKIFRQLKLFDGQLAIKGGGHTPFAGSANVEGGITLDLTRLKAVQLSDDQSTVSVGAGALWRDVYDVVVPFGLAVGGGRVSRVGVGGLTLGGGISFFSAQYGFVCDNVVNYEVVLASGEVINANQHDHADLWRALKGGSNNFGVVVSFEFRTFEQGLLWGGLSIHESSSFPRHLDAVYDLVTLESPPEDIHTITTFAFGQGGYGISQEIYSTRGEENPPALQAITEIPGQLYSERRIANLSSMAADHQIAPHTNGLRQQFMSTAFLPDRQFYDVAWAIWNASLATVIDAPGLAFALVWQPLSHAVMAKSEALGGNSLGLSPTQNLQVVLLVAQWTEEEDDERIIQAVAKTIDEIENEAERAGVSSTFRYLNYASATQNPLGSYGQDDFAQLKAVAKKYDAGGFFQKVVSGGFKLIHA